MPRGRIARYAISAVVALAAAYAFAAGTDWAAVAEAFAQAGRGWTAAGVLSVLLTLSLVVFRWGLLVEGEAAAPAGTRSRLSKWRLLWDAVILGQAVNILVPLRFGEGARLLVTSRRLEIPAGRVMVALAIERVFDAAMFATLVAGLLVSGLMPQAFRGLLPAVVTVTLATLAAAFLIVRLVPTVMAWLNARQFRVLDPAARWFEKQTVAMRDAWIDLSRRRQLARIALLTAVIPITAAATNYLVLRSFNLPVPAVTALVLLVVLQIGTAVVSVPGNIGVFHYLTVVTLAVWDVPQPTAVAVAIVLHIVSLGPKVVLGAFSLRSRA